MEAFTAATLHCTQDLPQASLLPEPGMLACGVALRAQPAWPVVVSASQISSCLKVSCRQAQLSQVEVTPSILASRLDTRFKSKMHHQTRTHLSPRTAHGAVPRWACCCDSAGVVQACSKAVVHRLLSLLSVQEPRRQSAQLTGGDWPVGLQLAPCTAYRSVACCRNKAWLLAVLHHMLSRLGLCQLRPASLPLGTGRESVTSGTWPCTQAPTRCTGTAAMRGQQSLSRA